MFFVVAIDGPAASGKGTVASKIASHFKFSYLDTGLIYRAVAKLAYQKVGEKTFEESAIEIAKSFSHNFLNVGGLKTNDIAELASKVAVIPEVREALISFQRKFSEKTGGTVLDGRDIGSYICPNAQVKFYITAELEVRARRRYLELKNSGINVSFTEVKRMLRDRDSRDTQRTVSPLTITNSAHLIDTSELSEKACFEIAKDIIENNLHNP